MSSAMWQGLETAGFSQGRVLEPGVGTGGFVASAPDNAHMVGIERDAMSALIANALYPQAQIRHEDFTETNAADNSFDATIGNVPFSQVQPYDPARNRAGLSTHNYFISKSIDLTAPGGYIAVVTSQHSADSAGRGKTSAQQLLTDRADFITGARLPGGKNGAFADYAGTEAGTDVLVFRKREDGQEPTARTLQFRSKVTIEQGDTAKTINAFFAENPENVLGTWEEVSGRFGKELAVQAQPDHDLGQALSTLLSRDITDAVSQGYGHTASTTEDDGLDVSGLITQTREDMQSTLGAMRYVDNEETGAREFEQLQLVDQTRAWIPVKCPKKYVTEWSAIIDLRDTTQAVLNACRNGNESELTPLRARLNEQYDSYVEAYGPLNRFELKQPPKLTEEKIATAFEKLEQRWRRQNPVEDRPFEGQLPEEVSAQLYDEASTNSAQEKHVQRHLGRALKQDPYTLAVLSLEKYDADTATATKGPLFYSNPLRTINEPQKVDTVQDAVAMARNHGLDMTLETFSSLLGSDNFQAVEEEITTGGLAFRHPNNPEQWIPGAKYLSGQVKNKLEAAQQAAETDPRFSANVQALKAVIPEKITSGITMSLGATWIPADVYQDFIGDTLGIPEGQRSDISVKNSNDKWFVSIKERYWHDFAEADMKWGVCAANAQGQYNFEDKSYAKDSHAGVAHRGYSSVVYSAQECINDVMNMEAPKLNLSKEAKERRGLPENKTVLHRRASQFAGTKADALTDHFSHWVTENPERYQRLIDVYNERFNAYVAPHYDGSYRELPGLSETFSPFPYQRNAVERMVNEPGVLLNHVVGAGKTGSMLMGAMELKRLGIAKQPWLVVPQHIVEQVGIDAKRWYPGANVLIGSPSESQSHQKEDRNMLLAQAASNDWDLVIVSDNAFKAAPMSPEYLEHYRDTQVARYEEDLRQVAQAENPDKNQEKDITEKRQHFISRMNRRIDKASNHSGIFWEDTGADYLIVDEAHNYKNLQRVSSLRDLQEAGSDRAQDMDMKLGYLRSKNGTDRPTVTFATGTPIANSIGELYTMTHYLAPQVLDELGLSGVNAWAQNFTGRATEIGFSPGGQIRPETRISMYENVGELAQSMSSVVDTVTRNELTVDLPELRTGQNVTVSFETDQQSKDLIQDLTWREQNQPRTEDGSRIDNPLKMINDGKAASLDPRLANLPYTPGVGRLAEVTSTVYSEWQDNRDTEYLDQQGDVSPHKGGLQIVFCDRGVPKADGSFSIYDAIREDLVAKGMDKDRIAFIHEWENDRTRLWEKCNNGQIDVLIANTAKMATGANIQSRAKALHHVDVPWRPADLEQREGRIMRQGNQNRTISIYNYVGKGTYDGHSWATVERKQKFISQFWNADRNMRSILPIEADGLNAVAHNKALATGNQDFVKEAELSNKVERLEAASNEHAAIAASNVERRKKAVNDISLESNTVKRLQPLIEPAKQWAETPLEQRTWQFGTSEQTTREDATQAMISTLHDVFKSRSTDYTPLGEIGGIPFRARYSAVDMSVVVSSPTGTAASDIPSYIIDTTRAHAGITPKEIEAKQRGLLSSLENVPRTIESRVTAVQDRLDANHALIEEIDTAPERDAFPDQAELDSSRVELREVKHRLEEFANSDAEKQRHAEYNARLQAQGRTHGFSLALNPTSYMLQEGIMSHPNAQPLEPPQQATAVGLLEPETGLFSTENMTTTPEDAIDTSLIEGDFEGVFYADSADQDYTQDHGWVPEDEQEDGDQMEQ
ncbi:MAG: hypothetical protein L0L17_00425 [Yaniella sp.]|nr:hypothetical protein [Yaniella sp.]